MNLKLSKKSIYIANIMLIASTCFLMIFTSCSSEEDKQKKMACDCVKEFEAYKFYSKVGEACTDYAIAKGKTDNPYGYFKELCNQ